MRPSSRLAALALALALALAFALGAGCSRSADQRAAADQRGAAAASVPEVSIDELDRMLASGAGQPVDANGDRTRKKLGVIPGAVLLTDSDTFLPSELPADKRKTLVFYCANTSCGASHEAAARARIAGYTNVKVLPDGIAGWVKAGKTRPAAVSVAPARARGLRRASRAGRRRACVSATTPS